MFYLFNACTKFHHVASCMNSSRVQDSLAQNIYLKILSGSEAHVRSLARTHVYCYNKNGQMIVDRKELSKKRKMVAEKQGFR